jgi:hypothetical protein
MRGKSRLKFSGVLIPGVMMTRGTLLPLLVHVDKKLEHANKNLGLASLGHSRDENCLYQVSKFLFW